MLSLLFISVLAQVRPPYLDGIRNERAESFRFRRAFGRAPGAGLTAQFELAPASGIGMGVACACADVTAARGGTIALTRATNATCSRSGIATTGIGNADLVVCSSNQMRVEPGADGILGLRVEPAKTNSILQSQTFNTTWSTCAFGTPLGVTLTTDQAVAPDGTTTAERLVFSSTTSAQSSCIVQANATGGTTNTRSLYVKSVSGNSQVDICSGGLAGQCSTCSVNATSWTRCSYTLSSGAQNNFIIGCDGTTKSGSCTGGDVYIWGAQSETSEMTSYIPTTTIAVTRNADNYLVTLGSAIGPNVCLAGTLSVLGPTIATSTYVLQLGTAAPTFAAIGRNSDTTGLFTLNATNTTPAVSAMGSTAHRFLLQDIGGTRAAYIDAVSVSAPAASMTGSSTTLQIANSTGTGRGVISRIQAGPTAECTR